jgi:hypothetical protein
MKTRQNLDKVTRTFTNEQERELPAPTQYTAPAIYVIGRSTNLLQGSGRHKIDDTGSPGFLVDQL